MNARRVSAAGLAALPGAGRASGGRAGPLERGDGAGGGGCWWGGAQSPAAGIGWVLVLLQPGVVAHPSTFGSRVRGDPVGRMPVLSHRWPTRRVSWSDLDMVAPAAALRSGQEHSLNVRGACPNMRGAYLEVPLRIDRDHQRPRS
jgi:hypothetical protein